VKHGGLRKPVRPDRGRTREYGHEADIAIQATAAKFGVSKWLFGAIGFQTIAMMGTVFGLVRFFVH